MADARRGVLARALLLALAPLLAAPPAQADDLLVLAQYHRPRRRRCWVEHRRVRDRFGRVRTVPRRVCR